MANNKEETIARNLAKIEGWNGETVTDIVDAAIVIRANGGKIDLADYIKVLPSEFADLAGEENIVAIDTDGTILYTDETTGKVTEVRDKKHRIDIGLAPIDTLLTELTKMRDFYEASAEKEEERVKRRKNETSALLKSHKEIVLVLTSVIEKTNTAADAMEEKLNP